MCMGGPDPKYALRELEQSFKIARQNVVNNEEKAEPRIGWRGVALAFIARFQTKDVTHG